MSTATQISARILFIIFLLLSPNAMQAKVVEQLIAVIDGEPYTLSNVGLFAKNKLGRAFPTGELTQINAPDRDALEQFITEKLLDAEIKEAGIKITDEDVDQYIAQIKAKNRLSDEDLKTALGREGQTLATYRAAVKSELERNEIINRQVRNKVSITNEDVERYYKLNSKNYRSDERARFRHILLSLPESASADQVQAQSAKAADLYKRTAAGEDFAKLAVQFSEGAGHAEGGDIGWVKRGTLINALEEVAFEKLSVGEVSQPFRTAMGIHIVKLEARETGNVLPLSAVAGQIKEELYAKALDERFSKWLKTDLRRKHRVDVKLPGVVFRAEDSKEGMVDSLMAKSARPAKRDDRGFLSYLNPFSYMTKEDDLGEEDPASPLYGKRVVSVLGVPLFTKEAADETPELPLDAPSQGEPRKSGGFFSSIVDSLNPFSSDKR
jgi:peptidyl-prolyl cis-trans isomerase SurA